MNSPADSITAFAFIGLMVVLVWLIVIGCMVLGRHIATRVDYHRQIARRRSFPGQEIKRVFPSEAVSIRPYETLEEYVRRVSR